MLVCSVSLRAPRPAIAADVVEAALAADGATTGNIVFATLVDAPASVGDHVDAYLGEIMVEAASAADTVAAGSVYTAAILEEATATATVRELIPVTGSIVETATATDTTSGTVAAPSRSAMLPGVMVSPSASREANVAGIMVNL